MRKSNWIISPSRGENKKSLKPPPSSVPFFRQLWLFLGVKLMEINSNGCFPGRHPSVDRISKKIRMMRLEFPHHTLRFFENMGCKSMKSFVCCVERDLKILDVQ